MLEAEMDRIRRYSNSNIKVENLACLITKENLEAIHHRMNGKKAAGIDGVTKDIYGAKLHANLSKLISRMRSQAYYPHACRRVYIDKPGTNKKRPLGISCYEDKLVENNVAYILNAIYEEKQYDFSYGFRPNRNCHQAIKEVCRHVRDDRVSYIVEADIRSFFDSMSHEWLIKFLEHDIADRRFLEIIRRMLKAGILENGKLLDHESGSPQGNGSSPILANVYLHYVLDMWFEIRMKKLFRGDAYLVRYADDYVAMFQYKSDAELFYAQMKERFKKYGLKLAEEKTRILEFGRFASVNRQRKGLGKPESFTFLGFTFYCSFNKWGKFTVKLKTSRKKMTAKLVKLNIWLRDNRELPVTEQIKRINLSLQGHYHYYGVSFNFRSMRGFRFQVIKSLFKWLNRRSQKKSYTWAGFHDLLKHFPIVYPKIYVSLFET